MPEVLTQVDEGMPRLIRCVCRVKYGDNPKCKRHLLLQPAEAERSRLECAVIDAAKAYGRAARAVEEHMKNWDGTGENSAAGWQLLRDMESTQEDLMLEALWPLLDFESQQIEK